jgi:hypothetical protein
MKKEFVTYEQALALKELGFDEPCLFHILGGEINFYRSTHDYFPKNDRNGIGCSAILYQQAFRWFREKHNLHSYIEGAYPWFRYYVNSDDDRWEGFKHLTHEEAESACLDELIEIIKNKQD